MQRPDDTDDATRRTLLRTLAATGLTGAGIVATTGSSGAQDSDPGRGQGRDQGRDRGQGKKRDDDQGKFIGNFQRFRRRITRDGEIVEECETVTRFEIGDEVTFDGKITLTGINITDTNELTVSGRLQGRLSDNRSEGVNETFDNISLGPVRTIFTILPSEEPEDCPIIELDIGRLFLEVLGLQLTTETVEIDLVAILGENNLLSDLLCTSLERLSRSNLLSSGEIQR